MIVKLGGLEIDPKELAYSRNAVLGIPDSGKTVTAKKLAELLMTASIPITALDPAGNWRFLRVAGKGRGFPVVVVGGADPDIALTKVEQAPDIMRAAMANGVSVVFDLYDSKLSKADWKRIVESVSHVLFYENKPHGLRHLFIEEAAEFVPQVVRGETARVYGVLEKIARMGRNAGLGVTFINQRAEELNKAVLELCDCLFLHRQKGRRSLQNLSKWLDMAEVGEREKIMTEIPTLGQGQCWAWAGDRDPVKIAVPMIESYHPNVRDLTGQSSGKIPKGVDVSEFVEKLKAALVKPEAKKKPDDSHKGKGQAQADLMDAFERGKREGFRDGWGSCMATIVGPMVGIIDEARTSVQGIAKGKPPTPVPAVRAAAIATPSREMPAKTAPARSGGAMTGPETRVLEAVGFWKSIGQPNPTREQVAALSSYKPGTGNFRAVVGKLCSGGYLHIPATGRLALTGQAAPARLSLTQARDRLLAALDGPQRRVLDAALSSDGPLSRTELAAGSGYDESTGNFRAVVGALCTIDVLMKPTAGMVDVSDWAREVL